MVFAGYSSTHLGVSITGLGLPSLPALSVRDDVMGHHGGGHHTAVAFPFCFELAQCTLLLPRAGLGMLGIVPALAGNVINCENRERRLTARGHDLGLLVHMRYLPRADFGCW